MAVLKPMNRPAAKRYSHDLLPSRKLRRRETKTPGAGCPRVLKTGPEPAPELFQSVSTWCIVTYKMDTLGEVVETLGGAKVLKDNRIRSFLDLDRVAHLGVPFRAFDSLIAGMNEPESTVANGIGIGRSTLNRRREQGRFDLDESQRVIRLGVILTLGKRALGSVPAASRWLLKPNRALGGRVPLELLQTEFGSRQVEAVLGRALYGGYS